jgi:hypothetical protein
MRPQDLQTLARAALIPPRGEAARLFDEGATINQVAADLGLHRAVAACLCAAPAPAWPRFTPEALAALPEHLRRQVIASNPNHRQEAQA